MRRDRVPLAVAGATAIVTCGLLAVAIAHGWLGPDVGRGDGFCEAARDALVRQPANTFSNLGFVVAGLAIAWHAGRPGNVGSRLAAYRHLPTVMACIVVFLGPGSAAMHATQSALGGRLDMLSMYLVASLALAYATMRFWRRGIALFAATFTAGVLLCELIGELGGSVPVVNTAGNTPAPPAVGAATMTPIAALTSCTANARVSTSRNGVPASGPAGPVRSLAASPPTNPELDRIVPVNPASIASRMTSSARANAERISSMERP